MTTSTEIGTPNSHAIPYFIYTTSYTKSRFYVRVMLFTRPYFLLIAKLALGPRCVRELLFAHCHFGTQFREPTLTQELSGVGKHLAFLVLYVMLHVLLEDFDLHVVGFVGGRDTRDLRE
jgi:hypothetical protein